MDRKEFRSPKAVGVVRRRAGYWTFLPAPLPPKLPWPQGLASALTDAERALSKLATLANSFPFPQLLAQSLMRQEAVFFSCIEGILTPFQDLYRYESAHLPIPEPGDDVHEVYNYVRALNTGLQRLDTLRVSLRLIQELHALLMEGVRCGYLKPGKFRRTQNWIAPASSRLESATTFP